MSSYNNLKNMNNSINSFNSSYISRLMNIRKNNGLSSQISKDIPLFFNNNKNTITLKPQKTNSNNDINQKILENSDLSNDIRSKHINYVNKTSYSSNNTNYNYYAKRRSQLYKNMKKVESETSQSRNMNKFNGNSLSRTTWSSFSYTEGTNSNNRLSNKTNGYDYKMNNLNNNKKSKIKNLKNRNNYNNQNKTDNLNGYSSNILKIKGIKYCIDKNGNPMNICDIKSKKKNPIAYIIPNKDKNILMDLDNKVINPNFKGDYVMPQRPYFVIKKYDVQYPELRVNNFEKKNVNNTRISNNSDYISINVNDSYGLFYNNDKRINEQKDFRKKNTQSCNLYSFSNFREESNKFFTKFDNKSIHNKTSIINPKNSMKKNNGSKLKKNLKEKRKYIFVNKLNNGNKSTQLKINIDDEKEDETPKLTIFNNTCKNKDNMNKFLYNNNNNNNSNTKNKDKTFFSEKNKSNFKLFIKNLNGCKEKKNKLKDIKCFTHKDIKNLEFKFERKYKNKNITSFIRPSYLTGLQFDKIEEIPKDTINKIDDEIKAENIKNNTDCKKEQPIHKKKYLFENIDYLDIKNFKKKRCSYSLNELMYSNMDTQNNFSTPNNMLNTLSTLNHSYFSPPSEATAYTTIQNLHKDLEKNKRVPISKYSSNTININKKFNMFKYYLKPKIHSQKVFHKRKKTEEIKNINKPEKKFRFFKLINENEKNNNITNNSIKKLYNTALDFSVKNCLHNSYNSTDKMDNTSINSSVCKCPFCHHLFYSQS